MSQCKSVTTLHIDGAPHPDTKVVIRCTQQTHDETDGFCSAVVLDSDPRCIIIWRRNG